MRLCTAWSAPDPGKPRYYWRKPVFWSRSYCIITVGSALPSVLKRHIEEQEAPE